MVFVLIGLVLAVAPWATGLFAPLPRYFALGLLMVLAAVVLAKHREPLRVSRAVGLAVVLAVLYMLRAPFAPASWLGAVNGALIMVAAAGLSIAGSTLVSGAGLRRIIAYAMVASSFVMSLIGLYGRMQASLAGEPITRLDIGFGYVNATAAWLMLGLVLALLLAVKPLNRLEGALLVATTPAIGAALALTGSRGALLALAVVLLLAVAVLRAPLRTFGMYVLSGGAAVATVVAVLTMPRLEVLGAALGASLALGVLVNMLNRRRTIVVLAVAALVGGMVGQQTLLSLRGSTYSLANPTDTVAHRSIEFEADIPTGRPITLHGEIAVVNEGQQAWGAHLQVFVLEEGEPPASVFAQGIKKGTESLSVELALPDEATRLRVQLTNWFPNTAVTLNSPYLATPDGDIALRNPWHLALPYAIAQNAQRFNLEGLVADGRRGMLTDGLRIARLSPWVGHGGGAWQALYSQVQSFYYGSTHAHSDPLEVLLDTGVVGLAVLALMLLTALWSGIVSAKKGDHFSGVTVLVFVGFWVHGAGEALLGFPAVMMAVFALLGTAMPVAVTVPTKARRLLVGFLLVAGVAALSFAGAEQVAETQPELATRLNPLSAAHQVRLAETLPHGDPEQTALYNLAARLEPNHPAFAAHLGIHSLRTFNFTPAVAALERAIQLQPKNIANYENAAFAAAEAAAAMFPVSVGEAHTFAERVLRIYAAREAAEANIATDDLRRMPSIRVTPRLSVDKGRALAILGRSEEAWPFLLNVSADQDGSLAKSANPWLRELFGMEFAPGRATNLVPTISSTTGLDHRGFTWWRVATPQAVSDNPWEGATALRGTAVEPEWYGIGTDAFGTVRAGETYTGSVYSRRSVARPTLLVIFWYSETAHIRNSDGPVAIVDGEWQRLTVTGVAPEGAVRARLYLFTAGLGAVGDELFVDAWQFEHGELATPWLPGQMVRVGAR